MGTFQDYHFFLLAVSLCLSAAATTLGAISFSLTPFFSPVVATGILTFVHHITILLAGRNKAHIPRIYTRSSVACTYLLTLLWMACLAVSITFAVLLFLGKIHNPHPRGKIWTTIVSGISLLETSFVLFLAIKYHKELKQIRYRDKWRWRIDTNMNASQWRSVYPSSCRSKHHSFLNSIGKIPS